MKVIDKDRAKHLYGDMSDYLLSWVTSTSCHNCGDGGTLILKCTDQVLPQLL